MRHPRAGELDRLDGMLGALRALDGLTERSPAVFYRRSKAFLHFHLDGDDVFADVRLDGREFERRRVSTAAEQRALVSAVRRALG